MRPRNIIGAATFLTVFAPGAASALDFKITDRQATSQAAACNALADALENIVNSALFPVGADSTFLQAMGNANVTATRGMGTDPVSDWGTLSLTTQVGAALEVPKPGKSGAGVKPNGLPALGVGAQGGVSVGLPAQSLGLSAPIVGLDPQRLKLYANFLTLPLGEVSTGVRLGFTTFGLQGQYSAVPASTGNFWINWSGLQVSSGLQYSHLTANYATPLAFSTSGSGIGMSYNAKLDLGVVTDIVTLPLEATAGITLIHFLTLYGGAGIDLNAGASKLVGGVSGPVIAKNGGGSTVFSGNGVLDANSPKGIAPKPIDGRVFLGFQLSAWAARLFAQTTFSSPNTLGVLAGLRASW